MIVLNRKYSIKNALLFAVFFLLTLGNGEYCHGLFGYNIEYIGLALLLACVILETRLNAKSLKETICIIIFGLLLSLGALINDIPNEARVSIIMSALLLTSYSKFARGYISGNKQIKIIGDALLSGMIVNILVGAATDTLGLHIGTSESPLNILFLCGMKVKNYCGGIWLMTFLLYYIYYYRNSTLNAHRIKLGILLALILLSGSKGAAFLAIVFLFGMRLYKNIALKNNREKAIFIVSIIAIAIAFALYIYSNVLINIPTYAYRMRGVSKLIDIMGKDSSKLLFGFQDIAYANTGFDYAINMRNYLGWSASVEMAYVNIIIKYGIIGYFVYGKIFKDIILGIRRIPKMEKSIAVWLFIIMILSGFTETYIASIHYVVGPVMYCLLYGIIYSKEASARK